MRTFSERYGYVPHKDAIIKETMPIEVANAICSRIDFINSDSGNQQYNFIDYHKLVMEVWCHFLNERRDDIYKLPKTKNIVTSYFQDNDNPWYRKIDLLEFILKSIFSFAKDSLPAIVYCNRFVADLNSEFERLHYGYRIVSKQVVTITSTKEIGAIEKAIDDSKDNIREHLSKAVALFADRKNPDYRNSIKESISAVEALCRKITDKSTLGDALKTLDSKGIKLQSKLKDGIEKLYAYTNQPSTGIRHSLMEGTEDYLPTYNEAYFMLVICSAFVNYINGLLSNKSE